MLHYITMRYRGYHWTVDVALYRLKVLGKAYLFFTLTTGLKKKAEYNLMKQNTTNAKPEDDSTSVTKTKTASKMLASNSQQRETEKQMPSSSTKTYSCCIACKVSHRPWECRVFKEKSPTQRAKLVVDNKLCFSCLWYKHIPPVPLTNKRPGRRVQ